MCSRTECLHHVGQYVRFTTPYGYHEGIIERVTKDQAIILSPRKYIPPQLASETLDSDELKRLDVALAWGGYGAGGYPAYGRGGYGAGYGGWGWGWGRWAASFLIIYVLWGLWW
ncbi:hypothetical protein C7445_105119 [Alicyclobacillus sacchari]|uniref:Uncharacterized protein n=1 Tax=Alicyclobacillus sacchari TaxID=392010 RepID=A0A4R8LQ20_9BACL|nr:hypothetical protein [Alicyclobacillus sacchari]TDY47940.1 hypothetical protein C7445_105119 [Alicyclobacillus sacchari]GMA56054.1 hypothetical protein GCM10025858_05570 [Alicyclobacillus sacchari]